MIKFFRTPEQDEPYPGNIWGWKFSLVGLVLILVLSMGLFYRHFVLGIPLNEELKYDDPSTFQIETEKKN
jgi:hypothetical protein